MEERKEEKKNIQTKYNTVLNYVDEYANGWYVSLSRFYYSRRVINEIALENTITQIVSLIDNDVFDDEIKNYCKFILRSIAYYLEEMCNHDDHIWRSYKLILSVMEYEGEGTKSTWDIMVEDASAFKDRKHYADLIENYNKVMEKPTNLNKNLLNSLTDAIKKFLLINNCSYLTEDNIDKLVQRVKSFCLEDIWRY